MNCTEKAKEVISSLDGKWDLYSIYPECEDEWNQDHAVFLIDLIEQDSEYFDYKKLEFDLTSRIREIIGEEIPVKYGSGSDPDPNYVLNIRSLKCGLTLEIELRKTYKEKS